MQHKTRIVKGKKEFLENLIFVVVLFSRELRLRPSVGPFDDDVYTNVFLFFISRCVFNLSFYIRSFFLHQCDFNFITTFSITLHAFQTILVCFDHSPCVSSDISGYSITLHAFQTISVCYNHSPCVFNVISALSLTYFSVCALLKLL